MLYRFLARSFDRLVARLGEYERVQRVPAYEEQFTTLRGVLRPLSAWLLARLGVVVLDKFGRPSSLLLWLSGFLLIWLLYRLAHGILADGSPTLGSNVVCVYTYIYIYIYMYVYVNTHTYKHRDIDIYIDMDVDSDVYSTMQSGWGTFWRNATRRARG